MATTISPTAEKAMDVVEWAHDSIHVTYEEIADMLGISSRTVHRWREREHVPLRDNAERIERLDELRFWLEQVFGEDLEAANRWLRSRIPDLRGKTPIEYMKQGRLKAVSKLLATFQTGAFV